MFVDCVLVHYDYVFDDVAFVSMQEVANYACTCVDFFEVGVGPLVSLRCLETLGLVLVYDFYYICSSVVVVF